MDDIRLSDLSAATRAPSARVSEILAGLGASPGNHGRRAMVVQLSDAIKVGVVRGLVMLGVPSSASLDIARQISAEDIKAILAKDGATWLGVCVNADNPDEFVFALCEGGEMQDIATDGRGSVRFLDIQSVARAVTSAALERKRSAATKEIGTVTSYSTGREINGVIVHGLSLAIVERGRGKKMNLSVEEARAIAAQLLSAANEHDPAGGLH